MDKYDFLDEAKCLSFHPMKQVWFQSDQPEGIDVSYKWYPQCVAGVNRDRETLILCIRTLDQSNTHSELGIVYVDKQYVINA